MNLRTKMLAAFSALFIAGFLFLLFFTVRVVAREERKQMEAFSTQSFEFKSQEVGAWLGQRVTELRMITNQETLQEGDIEGAVSDIARLNENVGTQYGNEWGTFAIGYRNGIGWVSKDQYIDVSERDYFKEAMMGKREYVLSRPVISRTDAADIALICYPLKNRSGQIYGFINAAISLNKLSEIVSELTFYDSNSWIMDSKGNIYTSVGTDHQGERGLLIQKEEDTGRADEASEDSTAGQTEEQAASQLVPLLGKTEKGIQKTKGKGITFYTKIPYTQDWYLCTSVQESVLMRDTRQLLVKLIMVCFLVLTVLVCMIYFLARSITRPVQRLAAAMKEVENGNLEVQISSEGKDEISRLSRDFDQMVRQLHALMLKTAKTEQEKRAAELRVLQAQINPHFLYNTLDTLLYKAYESGDEEMITMIQALSKFFRISLSKGQEIIPLERELEHVKSYLKIQKIRFQDVLNYEIKKEVEGPFLVLKLIVQPVVENAIQHGIKPKLVPGYVRIHIWQQEAGLFIEVADDGVGMTSQRLWEIQREIAEGTPGASYGLVNVSNRIRLLYGEKAGVWVESEEKKGTKVTIFLPVSAEQLQSGQERR